MTFSDIDFLLSLPFALGLYWALPSQTARRWALLALNLAFYATWAPVFVPLLLAYAAGILGLGKLAPVHKRAAVGAGVAVTLLLLLCLRHLPYLPQALGSWAGLQILIPV